MSDASSRRTLRVLIVEDSEDEAALFLRELQRGGYEPDYEIVDTPEGMERALTSDGEPWELILSDYVMPRFRAPEALEILRGLGYDTPFIIISGKVGEDLVVEAMRSGAQDYIFKDNLARLNAAVERELREAGERRERRRVEAALRRTEEKYRSIFENSAGGIFQTATDGRLLTTNPAFAHMLGYESPDDMLRVVTDVSRQVYADPSQAQEFLSILRESGAVFGYEFRAVRKDGSEILLSLKARLGRDEADDIEVVEGAAENITERKWVEEEMRESEERFRATFDQAAVGFLQVDLGGSWLRFNDKFCDILGYSREELSRTSVFDLIDPEDFDKDFERGVNMLAGEIREYTEEKLVVGKEGRRVWINLNVSLVYDTADEPRYFIAVVEDISERKWAEEELSLRERAIDASVNGIVLTDPTQPDNPIVYVNSAFERMTGYSAEEAIGLNCRFLQGDEGDQPQLDELRAAIRESRECRVVLKNRRKDGTLFWNALSLSPVFDERERLIRFVGVQEDITERRRAEEELVWLASFPMLNPYPIVETNLDGEPTYLNPAAEAHFPNVRFLAARHPALMGLEEAHEKIRASDGHPITREIKIGDKYYHQTISRVPEDDLLRIYATDITERRHAEEAVRASEERFRSLVQNASDVIVVLDISGTIIYESPAIENILGFTAEERIGTIAFDHIHPEDRERVMQTFDDYVGRGDARETVEYRARDKSGAWHYFEAVGTNLLEDPVVKGIVVNTRDITKRKHAEKELRESEERYRAFIAQSSEGILRYELEKPVSIDLPAEEQVELFYRHAYLAECNDTLARMYGFSSAEEIVGARLGDIMPYSISANVEVLKAGVSNGYKIVNKESQESDWMGNPKYFSNNLTGIVENGELIRGWGTQRDITSQKNIELALRQSEALYRTVVEQAAENIFVVDVETREILEANASLGRSLGYTEEELQNMKLYDIVDHDRESVDENIERILSSGRFFIGERVYRRKDGTSVDVEVTVSSISYQGRSALCIVAHDVTERKRIEEAMREVREAERTRIARDLHDDILQDMVYALQEIQMLQITNLDGGDPALEDTAEALRRSVEGLRVAIFELRLSENLERSFRSSMQALLEMNRRMSRNRFIIDMSVSDGFPQDIPEPKGRELVRIIQEALSNARRHASPNHVWVELGVDAENVWVQVTDDGKGFVPSDAGGGGGISSMQHRSRSLGGETKIESQPGNGTRMRFETSLENLMEQ